MYFCMFCGSQNTFEIEPHNGSKLYVGEDFGDSKEVFDGHVILIECKDCEEWSYPSQ